MKPTSFSVVERVLLVGVRLVSCLPSSHGITITRRCSRTLCGRLDAPCLFHLSKGCVEREDQGQRGDQLKREASSWGKVRPKPLLWDLRARTLPKGRSRQTRGHEAHPVCLQLTLCYDCSPSQCQPLCTRVTHGEISMQHRWQLTHIIRHTHMVVR